MFAWLSDVILLTFLQGLECMCVWGGKREGGGVGCELTHCAQYGVERVYRLSKLTF